LRLATPPPGVAQGACPAGYQARPDYQTSKSCEPTVAGGPGGGGVQVRNGLQDEIIQLALGPV
jgi:hypothetical protein